MDQKRNIKTESRRKNHKKRQRKNRKQMKKQLALYIALIGVAATATVGGVWWALGSGESSREAVQMESTAEDLILESEEETIPVPESESETETVTEEPDIYVEITEENREGFVKVESCEVVAGTGNFVLKASVENKPVSDDDNFYLLEMKIYDTELNQEGDYIDSAVKGKEFSLQAAVNENKVDSRLYSKFVVAVKLNGEYVPLCEPQYITNPEALAAYKGAFPVSTSIKGILVDPLKLRGSELDDLGVKHAAYNIPISNILGETTHGLYPTITYNYNGKAYKFNGQRIAEYDLVFSTLTKKGITISAILLNNKSSAQPQLIHPLSRNGSGHYYAFNTAEDAGIETMAAVGAFLAQRYRNNAQGIVMNWIIGNEVNVRTDWNYMQQVDLETYSREYANAVRVFYNSIKSMNANARVYVSMDQQWDRNIKNNKNYDVRDMLDTMNEIIATEGNIDWGLAHHPYAYPLDNTTFWNSSSKIKSLILDSEDTSIVTMENISVVTDYLQRPEMLTADGEVRPVILSELGYSSDEGEANQAAAFAYAYYAADANPYIDALILSRQTDAPEEVTQGLSLGLSTQGGYRKLIYEVFKHIDTPSSAAVTEFAKPIIGISSWSEITN